MELKSVKTIFLTGLITVGVLSCNENRERPVEPKVIDRTDNVEVSTPEYDREWEAFRNEAELRINDNERKIKRIEDEKLEAKKDGNDEYNSRIADLKERNNRLRTRMKEYKKDGNKKWEDFKREFNHDMDELGKALNDFTINNKK